ncbi:MAG: hypothetical protein PHV51_11190 [Methanosarcinaceae archaeon]|nr:hypothetical protein [Methanosarcinaceae archaeon]
MESIYYSEGPGDLAGTMGLMLTYVENVVKFVNEYFHTAVFGRKWGFQHPTQDFCEGKFFYVCHYEKAARLRDR